MQFFNSTVSRTRLKTPRQGAPGAEAAAAWSSQTAKSPRRARVPRQVLPHNRVMSPTRHICKHQTPAFHCIGAKKQDAHDGCVHGGGGSQKSDILLKKTPKPNSKRGGLGEVYGGFFAMRGFCPREGHPNPPFPPNNAAWRTQNGPGGMKGCHTCTPNEIHSSPHMVSGTSEQLGMRVSRCDPTICTTPTNVYGRVSLAWVFPAMGRSWRGVRLKAVAHAGYLPGNGAVIPQGL